MNIQDDLYMGEMGMNVKGFKKCIRCKLHNETDHVCPQECVGDCGKVGRGSGDMKCPNIGRRKGTYDAVILEKVERSWAVSSYADVTKEDVKTPLGQNSLIIS